MRKLIMGLWAGLAATALWAPATWASGKIVKEEAKGEAKEDPDDDEEEDEDEEEDRIALDKLPKTVVDAVKAKFPGAELLSAKKENDDGTLIYEVSIKHKGQDIDVMASPEGKITAIEKTIAAKDLPAKVSKALGEKYPKAKIKKAEELTKDDRTTYEVVSETADKKTLEVVFDPDGNVVEASTAPGDVASSQSLRADNVPANVRAAFQTKFPGVSKVEWKLKADKNYEAEFKQKDVEVAVKFDDKGKWLETETAIERSALPNAVLATILKEYKAYKIIETQKVERADNKPILFEVHLENGEEILKVQLEKSGAVASKSSKRKPGP